MDKTVKVPRPKKPAFGFLRTFGIGKEQEYFIENMSLMLASDMPASAAIAAMKAEAKSKKLLEILAELESDVNNGLHFWRAFDKTGLFPSYVISLIRIGEESGKLNDNLKVVVRQQQRERVFKSRIRSAMLYPALVLCLTFTIGAGVAWFILPRLATVFLSLHLKLPWPTRVLIALGKFLQQYGLFAVPAFVLVLVIAAYFIFSNEKTKIVGQKILLALPGIKNLVLEVELSRFGYIMGSLLSAGVPIVEAVRLLEQASEFSAYRTFYAFFAQSLDEGNTVQKTFQAFPNSARLVPVPVQQIIVSGEQSGKLQEVFFSVAANFEEKSEDSAKNLTVILEPILLVIVWLGVAMVALAVILPLYNLIGGLTAGESASTGQSTYAAATGRSAVSHIPPALASQPPTVSGVAQQVVSGQLTAVWNIKFLFVRQLPQPQAAVVGKIYPGKIYDFTLEQNGWYFISLPKGRSGWVSADYVEIVSQTNP